MLRPYMLAKATYRHVATGTARSKCSIRNVGTRYAGISTSGNCAIGDVVTVPYKLGANNGTSAPIDTATARSRMPRRFQITNLLLAANAGLRRSEARTVTAVIPTSMSPTHAGHAKIPGKTR